MCVFRRRSGACVRTREGRLAVSQGEISAISLVWEPTAEEGKKM
jgi:hypothetical protein